MPQTREVAESMFLAIVNTASGSAKTIYIIDENGTAGKVVSSFGLPAYLPFGLALRLFVTWWCFFA